MQVTWIIQTNMGSGSDILNYVEAVRKTGAKVIEVMHIPFSDELPEFKIDGPVVCYGAVSFISAMRKANMFPLSIFGTDDTFTYESWAKNYGNMLLNSPDATKMMTIKDFAFENRDSDELVFIRPQHDTKSIVGQVYSVGDFKEWAKEAEKGLFAGVTKDTPIIICQPYGIEAEWRLFVVDNEIVSASQYFKKGRLFKECGAPDDILKFAAKVIEKWNPARVYTLDLCRSAGNCYIVEVQGFNSAGAYYCDMEKVAKAVNTVASDLYIKSSKYIKKIISM